MDISKDLNRLMKFRDHKVELPTYTYRLVRWSKNCKIITV